MNKPNSDNIPAELKERRQWVLWREVQRGGRHTKVPYQVNGVEAKSNDSSTWAAFDEVMEVYERGGYSGIGFVFSKDDPFAGIDLDGCRHPKDGIAVWAQEIIDRLNSYTEVSPSGTGVKIFIRGTSPFATGRNLPLPQFGSEMGREAGLEIYDHRRFFTVTGQLPGKG